MKFIYSIFAMTLLTSMMSLAQEVDPTLPMTISGANQLVETLIKNKISSKEHFCTQGALTCRVHYGLQDGDGRKLDAFYVRFVSPDRSVGSAGYFFPVKGQPHRFVRFEDVTMDGKVNVNQIVFDNIVTVEKDKEGQVTAILGSILPRLGTTLYMVADLRVDSKAATLEGTLYDKENPSYSEKSKIEYLRINP